MLASIGMKIIAIGITKQMCALLQIESAQQSENNNIEIDYKAWNISHLLHPPLHIIKLLCKPFSSTSTSTTMRATMLLLLKGIVKDGKNTRIRKGIMEKRKITSLAVLSRALAVSSSRISRSNCFRPLAMAGRSDCTKTRVNICLKYLP